MALLQAEQTRYHENVKPRFSNPTYASNNVGSSLGMELPAQYRLISQRSKTKLVINHPEEDGPTSRGGKQVREEKGRRQQQLRRSNSYLSNYGTNSLKSLNRFISDKEVYQKQQKGYNIINVQPKEYTDTIKVYPKYRLENKDECFYRKLKLENDIAMSYSGRFNKESS